MTLSGQPHALVTMALAAGPVGAASLWLMQGGGALQVRAPGSWQILLLALVVAPILEELAFRGAVQDACAASLRRFGARNVGPISGANAVTSIAFCACHLPYQSAALSCAIVLPSLLLGRIREATGAVTPCILVHAWFNACFLALFTR
jgi:membrane protease YdiL (CAAX protease family)